ncbi:hypothetical protein AVEN_210651-1, partial [Araneus ventricosus]
KDGWFSLSVIDIEGGALSVGSERRPLVKIESVARRCDHLLVKGLLRFPR